MFLFLNILFLNKSLVLGGVTYSSNQKVPNFQSKDRQLLTKSVLEWVIE